MIFCNIKIVNASFLPPSPGDERAGAYCAGRGIFAHTAGILAAGCIYKKIQKTYRIFVTADRFSVIWNENKILSIRLLSPSHSS